MGRYTDTTYIARKKTNPLKAVSEQQPRELSTKMTMGKQQKKTSMV